MAYFQFSKTNVNVTLATVQRDTDIEVTVLLSDGWQIEKCFFHSKDEASKSGTVYRFPLDTDAFCFRITNGIKKYEIVLTKDSFVFRRAEA